MDKTNHVYVAREHILKWLNESHNIWYKKNKKHLREQDTMCMHSVYIHEYGSNNVEPNTTNLNTFSSCMW